MKADSLQLENLTTNGFVKTSGGNGTLSVDTTTYAPLASPTFTGTATAPTFNGSGLTASTILSADASKNIVSLATATYPSLTELSYVKGVTSAIQTQLNGKQATLTPAALTKVDDTNVTLTLGGTPATSLLQAVSLTLGWTGTLADARIASAATWNAKQAALSGTGIVKSTAGTISYLTDNSANWDTAYTNRITSLTTTGSSGAATLISNTLNIPNYTLSGLGGGTWGTLNYPTWVSGTPFVKMTAAGTFALDTNTYLTGNQSITLSGAVTGTGTTAITTTIATPGTLTVSSTNSTATAHTHTITSSPAPGAAASLLATDATGHIGSTGTRIVKGWFTDLQVTNNITGSITGNAATVTNATLTTALTVNTGTVTLTGNVANTSVLTIGAGAVSVSGSNTGDQDLSTYALKNGSNWTFASQAIGDLAYATSTTAYGRLASVAAGSFLRSGGVGTAPTWSTSTIPTSAGTAGRVLLSDGTNYVLSTPTFPNASATARKMIVSDGTNWVASTELWPIATTSGNYLRADGTNWVTTAPTTTPTATTLATWDANKNLSANNFLEGFTTTATAGGTTTLAIGSTYIQIFTGTLTQAVTLPASLVTGHQFYIKNQSTGLVTINATAGANTVVILAANTSVLLTCLATTATPTAATWDSNYEGAVVSTGKKLSATQSITLAGTDSTTMTFPTTSKTIAANDGSNWTIASQAIGDILTATSTTAYGRVADVATGNALISGGVGVAPSYGKIGLTTHISGTLPIANGGTNQTAFTTKQITYFDGTSLTGDTSLYFSTAGNANSNFGIGSSNVLAGLTTGANNLGIGINTMGFNGALGDASNNTAVGMAALADMGVDGSGNSAFGQGAGGGITTGDFNTMLGRATGTNMSTGSYNTVIGYNAGSTAAHSGSHNIYIGIQNVTTVSESNTIRIKDSISAYTSCYIEGIYGAADVTGRVMVSDSTGKLVAHAKLSLQSDGRLSGTALHNNAGAVTGTTNQYIASGTYTPTLTNTTNIAASTARQCQWIRVGNVVTVSGAVDIDPTTANIATTLGMSLPIASTTGAISNLGGVATGNNATPISLFGIYADTVNNRAKFETSVIGDVANRTYEFTFTYLVA